MYFFTYSEMSVVDRHFANFRIEDQQNMRYVATLVFSVFCLECCAFCRVCGSRKNKGLIEALGESYSA